MKLAVSFDMDSDDISPSFDSTMFFKMYDIDEGDVICSEIMSAMGKFGAENLSELLILLIADAVLCGEISDEAAEMLDDEGISFYSGFNGNSDETVEAFINGVFHFE